MEQITAADEAAWTHSQPLTIGSAQKDAWVKAKAAQKVECRLSNTEELGVEGLIPTRDLILTSLNHLRALFTLEGVVHFTG